MAGKFIINRTRNPENEYFGKYYVVLATDEQLIFKEPFDTEIEARMWIKKIKKAVNPFTKVEISEGCAP